MHKNMSCVVDLTQVREQSAKLKKQAEQEEEKYRYVISDKLTPLTWEESSVRRLVLTAPPPPTPLFSNLIPEGGVGMISGPGAVGKSFLLLHLSFSLATGKDWGIFKPTTAKRVLYLGGEDPEYELHRRCFLIAQRINCADDPNLLNNLAVRSVAGRVGPLLEVKDGNVRTSANYDWLCKSLDSLAYENRKIEVLILDPLSRFYGLNENDNTQATAWISCLERLESKYDLTVHYAHHESREGSRKVAGEADGRGATALKDGCRWAAGMRRMSPQDGTKFGVNPREYVVFDVSKTNYARYLKRPAYFKQIEGGVLVPVNLAEEQLDRKAQFLAGLLRDEKATGHYFSMNKLKREAKGKHIFEEMKQEFPGFARSSGFDEVVKHALKEEILKHEKVGTGGTTKTNALVPAKD